MTTLVELIRYRGADRLRTATFLRPLGTLRRNARPASCAAHRRPGAEDAYNDHEEASDAREGGLLEGYGAKRKCITITDKEGKIEGGRCAKLPDRDGDGRLDSCDNCVDVSNVDQANANFWAEVEEFQYFPRPHRGDACDPVPVFLLDPQRTENASAIPPPQGQGPDLREIAIIRGRSWLPDIPEVNISFPGKEKLSFRYCDCYDRNRAPLPLGACAGTGDCPGNGSGGRWIEIDVTPDPKNSQPELEQVFAKGTLGGNEEYPDKYEWWWYPLTEGESPIRSHVVNGEKNIRGLVGAVVNYGWSASDWDKDAAGRLRVTMVDYQLPKWKLKPLEPATAAPRRCFFGCNYWLKWWETLINPNPIVDFMDRNDRVALLAYGEKGLQLQFRQGEELNSSIGVSGVLADLLLAGAWKESRMAVASVGTEPVQAVNFHPETGSNSAEGERAPAESSLGSLGTSAPLASAPERGDGELSSNAGPGLDASIFEAGLEEGGSWAWLAASEPGRLLAESNVEPVSVLVPREGSSVARPVVVRYGGEGLVLGDGEFVKLPEGASPMAAVQLPLQGAAAFSAIENAIYIAGGVGNGDEGTIRRYDFSSGAWDAFLPHEYAPSGDVRGIAYDLGSRLLYVLDVENKHARIVAHRFSTREADLLWSAPLEDGGAALKFGIDGAGNLVLVRSSRESFTAWRSRIDEDGEFRLDRAFEGKGEVFDHPVMGYRELLLPVLDGGDTSRLVPLWPQRFEKENPCVSL